VPKSPHTAGGVTLSRNKQSKWTPDQVRGDDTPVIPGCDDTPVIPGCDDTLVIPGCDDTLVIPGLTRKKVREGETGNRSRSCPGVPPAVERLAWATHIFKD